MPLPPVLLRAKHTILRHPRIAAGVAAALVALILLAGGGSPPPEEAPNRPKIQVEQRAAELHRRSIVVYGATEPVRDIMLNAQTSGMVTEIVAKEGDLVEKGAVILKIDPRERAEQVQQAQSLLSQRQIEYEAARKLNRGGFQSKISLAESLAQLKQAQLELKRATLDLEFSDLTAPFDGRVEQIAVEVGDFVGIGVFGLEGAPARVVQDDPMLVVARLSEKDRPHVNQGDVAMARLNDGREFYGVVRFVGDVADANSRTFRVEAVFDNADGALKGAMTAELHIKGNETMAYRIRPSMLALDDDGRVGVKHLDESNTVRFEPVEIIEDDREGMWIATEPEQMRLITFGQAYMSSGQVIAAEMIHEQGAQGDEPEPPADEAL